MRKLLSFGLALTLVACGNDAVVAPSPGVAGSYVLERVDGTLLPYTSLDLGAYRIQLVSGSLTLNANNTYALKLGLRVDDSGRVRFDADSDAGTWTRVDNAVSFTSTQRNFARTATVSSNVMTMRSSTIELVYRKQ